MSEHATGAREAGDSAPTSDHVRRIPSIPTAAASAAVTAATAAPAAAAAASASAAAAVFTGLGLVHGEPAAVVLALVEAVDGRLGLGLGVHLHEAEPLAPARLTVLNNLGALHGPELRKPSFEVG